MTAGNVRPMSAAALVSIALLGALVGLVVPGWPGASRPRSPGTSRPHRPGASPPRRPGCGVAPG
ncbi:hypothetical protein NKG94_36415 [Micromonospora sp. M12]